MFGREERTHFPVEFGDLVDEDVESLDGDSDLHAEDVDVLGESEGVLGGVFETARFLFSEASATGFFENVCEFSEIDFGEVGGGGELSQEFPAGGAEEVGKELSVFRKDEVEECDEALFLGDGGLSGFEAQARQTAKGQDVFFGNGGDFEVLIAEDEGDQEGVDGVGFRAADEGVASRGDDQGVDDGDVVADFDESLIEEDPVMAGRLHADVDGGGREAGGVEPFQESVEALLGIGEGEVSEDDLSVVVEQRGVMFLFGDIDAERRHDALHVNKSEKKNRDTEGARSPDLGRRHKAHPRCDIRGLGLVKR